MDINTITQVARVSFLNYTQVEFNSIVKYINRKYHKIPFHRLDGYFVKGKCNVGNFCITGIPYDVALTIEAKYNIGSDKQKCKIDNIKPIITPSMIDCLKEKDKVTIELDNLFGINTSLKGTVYEVNDNSVTVMKYRSRTKGWKLSVNQVGKITKGWEKG